MKKLALTISAVAMAVSAFAQGTVNFNNLPTQQIRTNSTALGGGIGLTANTPQGFYYGLFIAPVGTLTSDLRDPAWTFTSTYATNTAGVGRLSGGLATGVPVNGWAGGTSANYVVAGWSASLGHDWALVLPQYDPAYAAGVWAGSTVGFFGQSVIGTGISGGGPLGQPVLGMFGAAAPSIQGFNLFAVPVPEPATFALAGLGAAALLIFRRRK